MKKLLLIMILLLTVLLAESQTYKRITTANPNYRWQQRNTFQEVVTRCNSSGTIIDTLAVLDSVRAVESRVSADIQSVSEQVNDTLQYLTSVDQDSIITLIDGNLLNVGLLYFVTDRNWLLVAVADSLLKPVSGSMTLLNGDTLITGVEPDVLWIKLPEYAYTNETQVVVDQSYYPTMMIVKNDNAEGDPSRAKLYSESSSTVIMGYNGDNASVSYGTTVIYFANESNLPSYVARDVYNISDEANVTAIIIIKFERSQF